MGKESLVRQSNIELLRIVLMLMILLLHANYFTFGAPSGTDLIERPLLSGLRIYAESLTIVAVNCFVLISGYFGLKLKLRAIYSLLFQVYFYSISIFIFFSLIGSSVFSLKLMAKAIFPFINLWFVGSYLGLLLFSPMLNVFVENISQQKLYRYLILFYIAVFLFGYLTDVFKFFNGYSPVAFIGIYLTGRYIRLYGTDKILNFPKLYYIAIYIVSALLCTLLFGFLFMLPIESIFIERFRTYQISYTSPFTIISSIALFMFFLKLNIQSKWINWMATSALAVYLIHCDPNIVNRYCGIIWQMSEILSVPLFTIFLFVFVMFILIISILIDKIRIFIWNKLLVLIKGYGLEVH